MVVLIIMFIIIIITAIGTVFAIKKDKEKPANDFQFHFGLSAYSNGYEYENYVATWLTGNGYRNVKVTKRSGDGGADIICVGPDGWKYAVQCKMYKGNVGYKAVQEIYTAKTLYDCDMAMVVTNSSFTQSAIDNAKKLGVVLYSNVS